MEQTTTLAAGHEFSYPSSAKVYGIVVDDRLGSPVIKIGLDALHQVDGDLLVFLCLAPHDIRTRTDWDDLVSHIRFRNGKERECEVRLVQSPEELLIASLNMRVLRLPVDFEVI